MFKSTTTCFVYDGPRHVKVAYSSSFFFSDFYHDYTLKINTEYNFVVDMLAEFNYN